MSDTKSDTKTVSQPSVRGEVTPQSQPSAQSTKLRAFHGNSFDDYYDCGMRDFPLPATLLRKFVVWVLYHYSRFMWPWTFENEEALINDSRGRVIIMNHESMLDPVILGVILFRADIMVRTVYKSSFDRVPLAKWLFSRVGGFPVERDTADMKLIRRARTMLTRGECIMIFPEGTRIKDDKDSKTHGGYALMAQLAKAPVQPTAICGARHLHFRSRVACGAGDLIEWTDIPKGSRKEQLAAMEELGLQRCYELRDKLCSKHPEISEA